MDTRVIPYGDDAIAEAARLITAGLPVAMPTETVYGLAADATSGAAVAAIYAAKNRPPVNPLIVHVADLDAAQALGVFDDAAVALAAQYWPGPLTVVVPRRARAGLAPMATAGLDTVAIRVPQHRAMQALLRVTGKPLAAPSANASGTISPTRAAHVLRTLNGKIALIVDDGPTSGGIESSIVKVDSGRVITLRPGPVIVDAAVSSTGAVIEAPGQLAAHYAPSKPLRMNAEMAQAGEWLLGFGAVAGDVSLSQHGDLDEAASRLFDLLHAADASSATYIAVAPIPDEGVGRAINDRLRRAVAGSK